MRILLAGARGEVGRTVSAALADLGHEVIGVSSRAPLAEDLSAVDLATGISLIGAGRIDGVINCAGRGDRRDSERTGRELTESLRDATTDGEIPGVLISTTRVLEGHSGSWSDDLAPHATTPYAEANALNETIWLATNGSGLRVLRITNYFAPPAGPDSPQALLLPWSLVTEALAEGTITMRSGPSPVKEFVGASGVAQAAVELLSAPLGPRTCATAPGLPLSLRELADCCAGAVVDSGRKRPRLSFGPDSPPGPGTVPGYLASTGWSCDLTAVQMRDTMASWILQHYAD